MLIAARNDTRAGLDSARASLQQFAGEAEKSGEGFSTVDILSGHIVKELAGGVIALHAIKGGLEAVTGVAELFKGHTKEAVEAFEKLPVVGRFIVRPFADMLDVLTGAKEETAKRLELEKQELEIVKQIHDVRNKIAVGAAELRGQPFEARRQAELGPFGVSITEAREARDKIENDIKESLIKEKARRQLAAGFGSPVNVPEPEPTQDQATALHDANLLIESLEKEHQQKMAAIGKAEDADHQKEIIALGEANQREAADRIKHLAELFRTQEEHNRNIRQLQSENRALLLEQQGDGLAAEKERIKSHYDELIKLAEDNGDREQAQELRTQEKLRLGKAQRSAEERVDRALEDFLGPTEKIEKPKLNSKVAALESRLLTRAGETDDPVAKNTSETVKGIDGVNDKLETAVEELDKIYQKIQNSRIVSISA